MAFELTPVNVSVDLDVDLTNSTMDSVHINQYEDNARVINCRITNNGVPYTLKDDDEINIRVQRNNGTGAWVHLKDWGGMVDPSRTMIIIPVMNDATLVDAVDGSKTERGLTAVAGRHAINFEIITSTGKNFTRITDDMLTTDTMKIPNGYGSTKIYVEFDKDKYCSVNLSGYNVNTYQLKESGYITIPNSDKNYISFRMYYPDGSYIDESDIHILKASYNNISFYDINGITKIYTNVFYVNVHKTALSSENIKASDDFRMLDSYVSSAKQSVDESLKIFNDTKEYINNNDFVKKAKEWAVGNDNPQDVASETNNSHYYSLLSQSYAHGNTNIREGEDTDNSQYYYEKIKNTEKKLENILGYIGECTFDNIPIDTQEYGNIYRIKNAFMSDSRFIGGSNLPYPAGTCIVWTNNNLWLCLSASSNTTYNIHDGELIPSTNPGDIISIEY